MVLESRDFLKFLPVDYLDGMPGLGQHVQSPQCLDRSIDMLDGKACGVSDIDL